jgi:hypothetical protein
VYQAACASSAAMAVSFSGITRPVIVSLCRRVPGYVETKGLGLVPQVKQRVFDGRETLAVVLPSSPDTVPDTIPSWSANVSNAVNNDISIVGICMFPSK